MPLESTMICLDNSDWMRNGDYTPCRLDAQQDAASIICNDRTNSNPENTVGILTMAGGGVELRVSPTEENGKILASFAHVPVGGKTDLVTSVQIAQLALKHRKNKNGGKRIIVFIGSPIMEAKKALVSLGTALKKNGVSIDIISVGEFDDNSDKLNALIEAANTSDNSHLIVVQPGVSPANAIMSSPIMHSSAFAASAQAASEGGAGGTSDFDMYGGIDPSMDPELAMAIRVSAEEARAEEEARNRAAGADSSATDNGLDNSAAAAAAPSVVSGEAERTMSGPVGEAIHFAGFGGNGAADEEDEEMLMQRALEMSMREMTTAEEAESSKTVEQTSQEEEIDEEEELRRALELSTVPAETLPSVSTEGEAANAFVDPEFVSQLLGGADQSDPLIQAAMQQILQQQSSDKKEEDSKKRKNDGEDK